MAAGPFAFLRGAAAIMAADLAPARRTGLTVQLSGDAHLANFGGFASPERDLVFDVNDFDETLPGPFEWDVKRLVTSIEVAARSRGFSGAQRAGVLGRATHQYRQAMGEFAGMLNLDLWYTKLDSAAIVARWGKEAGSRASRTFSRFAARHRDPGPPEGDVQAHPPGRRRAPLPERPAATGPGGGGLRPRRPLGHRGRGPGLPPDLPPQPAGGPAPPAGDLPVLPSGPEGGGGGERRHPLLGGALRGA